MKDADLDMKKWNIGNIEELSKAYTWVRYPDLSQRFYLKYDVTQKLLIVAREIYLWVKKKFENS